MDHKTLYKILFQAASLLTDRFPHTGAWLLNRAVLGLLGSRFLFRSHLQKNIGDVRKIKRFDRFLVIGDLNIGDAINLQASIAALRDFFPEAEIDFVMNRHAACLIEGNLDISNLWPVFTGAGSPSKNDYQNIVQIVSKGRYDVIFNFCPFFRKKSIFPKEQTVINYSTLASMLLQNEKNLTNKNHIIYQTYKFIHSLFSPFLESKRENPFNGVIVTISDRAIIKAQNFLISNLHSINHPLIVYNPDTSSSFTRIPFTLQVSILKRLINLSCVILLGSGHTLNNIESSILNSLPPSKINKVIIIPPSMPLDAYAVLIDCADVFITGDTGLLHIGAAHKCSMFQHYKFRNQTAVLSIFGATPARIYGYDSVLSEFIPANQDAPSRVYIAESPCRNITCLNKIAKTCKTVRCFQYFDTEKIMLDVISYLMMSKHCEYFHGNDLVFPFDAFVQ